MLPAVYENLQEVLKEQHAEIDPATLQYLEQLHSENPSAVQNIVENVLDEPPKPPPRPKEQKRSKKLWPLKIFQQQLMSLMLKDNLRVLKPKDAVLFYGALPKIWKTTSPLYL